MIKYHGKEILTALEELVKPEHTALIVVDIQNDFCVLPLEAARSERKLACPEMVSKTVNLIEHARQAEALVVYLQDTLLPRRMSDSAPYFKKYMRRTGDPKKVKNKAIDRTWGHEIIEEIKPQPGEAMIIKYRSDGFVGTGLDLLLRSNQIKTTVFTGMVTGGCVAATARSAANEYFVVVAQDCCWSPKKEDHDAALSRMKGRYDVVPSEEIIQIWKKL